jgi:hypothetical protein
VADMLFLDMQIQGQPLAFALTFLSLIVVIYFVTFRLCILVAVNINCPKVSKKFREKYLEMQKSEKIHIAL